jgi:protein-arginine kinase activator protein McsA
MGFPTFVCSDCLVKRWPLSLVIGITERMRGSRQRGSCPYCGTTEAEIVELGLAGCPLCYEVFPANVWKSFGLKTDSPVYSSQGMSK